MIQYNQRRELMEELEVGELRVDIPDDLHKALKRRALDESSTLKELVTKICHSFIKSSGEGLGSQQGLEEDDRKEMPSSS